MAARKTLQLHTVRSWDFLVFNWIRFSKLRC
ncbi:hypothetical protein AB3S75_012986 [Citrus x aurantiifolia]